LPVAVYAAQQFLWTGCRDDIDIFQLISLSDGLKQGLIVIHQMKLNAKAVRIGLVELLAESSESLIERILTTSTYSAVENKRVVRCVPDGQNDDDEHTLRVFGAAITREDFAEGVKAFAVKRNSDFG